MSGGVVAAPQPSFPRKREFRIRGFPGFPPPYPLILNIVEG